MDLHKPLWYQLGDPFLALFRCRGAMQVGRGHTGDSSGGLQP